MAEIHQKQTDITVNGRGTRLWMLDTHLCPALGARRIARLGIDSAVTPYSRVRLRPAGSFFLASISGEGRALLDGRWQRIPAGVACMAPPRVHNAFHAVPGKRWVFCWVRYEEPAAVAPLVGTSSPVRVRFNASELAGPIEGLRLEWEGARDSRLIHHWVELIHETVRRAAQPRHRHERLWRFWESVAADLAADWDLGRLAASFHSSKEQLRRICHRELGRSPMHHLTYMRIQRAQELLDDGPDKLEVIASQIGYDDALAFSRAFRRWVGCSPSDYRRRHFMPRNVMSKELRM